uniref:Uncharacterized protein n=1 Tax=Anopheles epiroticus TaxID=199890 RepID=A0A182P4A9_9DIPT
MFRGKIRTNTCRIVVLTSLVWLLIDVILIVKYAECPSGGDGSSWLCRRSGYDVESRSVLSVVSLTSSMSVRGLTTLLLLFGSCIACLHAKDTPDFAAKSEDMVPLTQTLQSHVEKFKKLRDDLKALQETKEDQNPLVFFRETMRIMDGLQSLGKEWKDIERMQNRGKRSRDRVEFESVLEQMDPLCGQRNQRSAALEIELRCQYSDLGGNPYYLIGPVKEEQLNLVPFRVTVYRDLLTEGEVRRANETRQIEVNVRQRLNTLVPDLVNVAVRKVGENGYNGSRVKQHGVSMMLYLETRNNGGMTMFPGGTFIVAPTSGSLLVSKERPSICPSNSAQD